MAWFVEYHHLRWQRMLRSAPCETLDQAVEEALRTARHDGRVERIVGPNGQRYEAEQLTELMAGKIAA